MSRSHLLPMLKFSVTAVVLASVGLVAQIDSATLQEVENLYDDVIKAHGNRLRPVANQSAQLDVYLSIFLMSLLNIDDIQQSMVINAWINFTWVDEIRTWDPDQYDGLDVIHIFPLDVWRPRMLISTSLTGRDVFEDDYAPLLIMSNGVTKWYPGAIFSLSCALDLTYFPFDEQTCMMMVLGNELAQFVNFVPVFPHADVNSYIQNGEWDLVNNTVVGRPVPIPGEVRPGFILTLSFKRRPLFFMLTFFVPIMLLSLLSFLVFLLPEESGERASFAITVLLSFAVFMSIVASQLPQSSESFPLICEYLLAILFLTGIVVVIAVVQLDWYHRQKRDMQQETSATRDDVEKTRQKRTSFLDNEDEVESSKISSVEYDNNLNEDRNGLTIISHESYRQSHKQNLPLKIRSDRVNPFYTKKQHAPMGENESKERPRRKVRCISSTKKYNNLFLFLAFFIVWCIITLFYLHRIIR